jgi:UDP-N-acetylglucosamine--N-acetylmuramyl-(pentapeptide) pyrophosphoryl-undecaprenol N-acetylglucosamine transferase
MRERREAPGNPDVLAFTGGGTGGHIYPGLAVADRLRELLSARSTSARIVWLGSTKVSDRAAVEAAGLEFFPIPSGKLRREISLENLADAFRVVAGYGASRRVLAGLRPRLLFSKGGYVSVPPCRAAASLGIPVFTHESDFSPGLATRLNAGIAETVFVSYEETRDAFPPARRPSVIVSGQPIRAAIRSGDPAAGRIRTGFPEGLPLILVIGGSQGARRLNDLVEASLPGLLPKACVIHQTGPGNPGVPREALPRGLEGRYRSFEYLREELPDLLAAASLYVGRAGAGSLWECAAAGLPMVLIPLAGAGTRGDQVENARWFAARLAARVLEGRDAEDPSALVSACLGFLDDPEELRRASRTARDLGARDAADIIARAIVDRAWGNPT